MVEFVFYFIVGLASIAMLGEALYFIYLDIRDVMFGDMDMDYDGYIDEE